MLPPVPNGDETVGHYTTVKAIKKLVSSPDFMSNEPVPATPTPSKNTTPRSDGAGGRLGPDKDSKGNPMYINSSPPPSSASSFTNCRSFHAVLLRGTQERYATSRLYSMNGFAATRVASQRAVATCNLYLSNSPIIRHVTKDAQATAAFTRIFPEYVKDKMTMSKPRSINSNLQSESGMTLQGRQKICHNQVRDDFASIARGNGCGSVVVEPTLPEAQLVNADGVFVTERRGPDVLCRTAAEDVYGDVSIVQVHRETVNANSLATFQTLRQNSSSRALTVSYMLASLQTTVVDKLNLAANQKLKSYPRIATGPQVDGPTRYFFPVIISPDAVLHGSAFDFVDAVCKTTAAFHRPGARERLLASMISSVHSVMKYRNLSMPTLRGALLMSRA
jgi:hypothetical protein